MVGAVTGAEIDLTLGREIDLAVAAQPEIVIVLRTVVAIAAQISARLELEVVALPAGFEAQTGGDHRNEIGALVPFAGVDVIVVIARHLNLGQDMKILGVKSRLLKSAVRARLRPMGVKSA
jgi:hypothetical protein